ncbi:MAG TPA: asparagine synthase C-terminal domain-containing protein [Nitrososphaeraceae archaeon]|nr:asparagine synthase C-terminal domain-containing protein [Nitrososphaeraceae archaeon]
MQQIEKSFPNISNIMTLRYDPSKPRTKLIKHITYESMKDRSKPYPSFKDIETQLRKLIKKNILKLKPTNISLALSSGIDSNLILSLLSAEFPNLKIHCITVTFDEFSEAKTVKKIVENYPSSSLHEVIVDNPLRDLPLFISIIKEPRWNLYQYYFIKKAKDFSNIIFTGDGGDELFGGYSFRYKKFLDNYNYKFSWRDKVRLYLECHERDWVPDQNILFDKSLRFDWEQIYSLLKVYFDNDLAPLDQVFMADYYGKLMYDFVPTQKKFLDLFNLIGITPLLDPSIIDMSTKMPPSAKYNYTKNQGKIPLRKILLVKEADNISKNKLGFSLDIRNLWIREGKEIVTSNLDKGQIFESKLVRRDFYKRSLKRIEETLDVRYISKMLQLLSLEIWYKMFITLELSSKNKL